MHGSRPTEQADLPRVVELADAAALELARQRGGEIWSRREARADPRGPGLREALTDAAHHAVVGTYHGSVVGYGMAHLVRLHDGGALGVVTDLYVEPDARGVGVGEAMMNDLVAWCRDQGCVGVDSLALPGDRATKNFFESFGLVARAIIVHRRLR